MIRRSVLGIMTVAIAFAVLCGCDYSDYDWGFPLEEKNEALLEIAYEEPTPPEGYAERMWDVYSQISELVGSKEYKRAGEKKRVRMLQPLIKQLYDDGDISAYKFYFGDTESYVSYEYSVGGKGVAFIKEHRH